MPSEKLRILILCKTYPSPSAKHAETSCVAGMDERGALIRLYPVPFRLIDDSRQFKKYQWVTARVEKSKLDHRPESHRVFVDTIACDDNVLPTDDHWAERRHWLDQLPRFGDFAELDEARKTRGVTLGLVQPSDVLGLDIVPTKTSDWTETEKNKLVQLQRQGDMFDSRDRSDFMILKKIPFDFYYRYSCSPISGTANYRHKIVDWEVGALYWKLRRSNGSQWEKPFREKLEHNIPSRDLMFLLGTIHRFPDQWLIISLIYPPKQRPERERQGSLF